AIQRVVNGRKLPAGVAEDVTDPEFPQTADEKIGGEHECDLWRRFLFSSFPRSAWERTSGRSASRTARRLCPSWGRDAERRRHASPRRAWERGERGNDAKKDRPTSNTSPGYSGFRGS